jgi:CheY-like chemotaxis protein
VRVAPIQLGIEDVDGETFGMATTRSCVPDVVISDLGLPRDFDGYALARALRSDPKYRSATLIALSGYANEEARRRSHDAGYDQHFAKPPDLDRLRRTLADVARR